jgi:hypothetical protein
MAIGPLDEEGGLAAISRPGSEKSTRYALEYARELSHRFLAAVKSARAGGHAKTGAVSEYAQIEEALAPEAMEKIAAWILAVQ